MADVRVLGVAKDLDLAALNKWIAQRERTLAPVVATGEGETAGGSQETAVSFDLDQPTRKSKFAKVKLKVGDAVVVAPDETLVCEGKAYISGVLTAVFLVRKTS